MLLLLGLRFCFFCYAINYEAEYFRYILPQERVIMGCPLSGVAQDELEIGWLDLWCPARYPFDLFTFGF